MLHAIRRALPFSPKPKASGFGQIIASHDEGDESRAFAKYAGEFCFGDETIVSSAPFLFTSELGSGAWQQSRLNLAWLADFSSSKRQLHAHYALRLLGRWNKSKRARKNLGPMSKSLIALCTHGSKLALSADSSSQVEFLRIVSETAARVSTFKPRTTLEASMQAASLLYASTAFDGLDGLRKSACDSLNSIIDQLVLPDGGPVSRRAEDLIDLMALLLPLQAAMKLSRQIFPIAVADALHRMFPVLAMFADGTLAGGRIATLMAYDIDARPLKLAQQTGFARLVGGKTILFADTKCDFQFDFTAATQRLFTSKSEGTSLSSQAALHDSVHGIALQVVESASRERIYFLSADGTDLRVEDHFASEIEIIFDLAPQVKIASTREGDILLVAQDQTVWNLTLRGGEAQVEQNGTVLRIFSTATGKMNWAFKKQAKIAKSTPRKKSSEPDLLA